MTVQPSDVAISGDNPPEDVMSNHLSNPTSRLICLGGAKLATNASLQADEEGQPQNGFEA